MLLEITLRTLGDCASRAKRNIANDVVNVVILLRNARIDIHCEFLVLKFSVYAVA